MARCTIICINVSGCEYVAKYWKNEWMCAISQTGMQYCMRVVHGFVSSFFCSKKFGLKLYAIIYVHILSPGKFRNGYHNNYSKRAQSIFMKQHSILALFSFLSHATIEATATAKWCCIGDQHQPRDPHFDPQWYVPINNNARQKTTVHTGHGSSEDTNLMHPCAIFVYC